MSDAWLKKELKLTSNTADWFVLIFMTHPVLIFYIQGLKQIFKERKYFRPFLILNPLFLLMLLSGEMPPRIRIRIRPSKKRIRILSNFCLKIHLLLFPFDIKVNIIDICHLINTARKVQTGSGSDQILKTGSGSNHISQTGFDQTTRIPLSYIWVRSRPPIEHGSEFDNKNSGSWSGLYQNPDPEPASYVGFLMSGKWYSFHLPGKIFDKWQILCIT